MMNSANRSASRDQPIATPGLALITSRAVEACQPPTLEDRKKCSQPTREKRSRSRIAMPTAKTISAATAKGSAKSVGV
jgi:hypothetical protein